MVESVVYVAIFKDADKTVVLEYLPLKNADGFIGIEIVDIDIQQKPVSPWKERIEQRKRYRGRGLVLTPEEEHAEAMQPTTQLERARYVQPKLWDLTR